VLQAALVSPLSHPLTAEVAVDRQQRVVAEALIEADRLALGRGRNARLGRLMVNPTTNRLPVRLTRVHGATGVDDAVRPQSAVRPAIGDQRSAGAHGRRLPASPALCRRAWRNRSWRNLCAPALLVGRAINSARR
jgi:hypothetical protein